MNWTDDLYQFAVDIWLQVHHFALWLERQAWPLKLLAPVVSEIAALVGGFAGGVGHLMGWVNSVVYDLTQMLTWENIAQLLSDFLNKVSQLWSWFLNWAGNVLVVVNSWWQGVLPQLQGIINALFPGLLDTIAGWAHFFTVTMPTLLTNFNLEAWWQGRLADIKLAIDSALAPYANMLAEWQKLRDTIFEFLLNPVGYIWDRFLDWFLGEE